MRSLIKSYDDFQRKEKKYIYDHCFCSISWFQHLALHHDVSETQTKVLLLLLCWSWWLWVNGWTVLRHGLLSFHLLCLPRRYKIYDEKHYNYLGSLSKSTLASTSCFVGAFPGQQKQPQSPVGMWMDGLGKLTGGGRRELSQLQFFLGQLFLILKTNKYFDGIAQTSCSSWV